MLGVHKAHGIAVYLVLYACNEVENGTDGKAAYLVDVSAYVLCVTVDPGLTSETVPAINGASSYSFSGEYTKSCTGIKGFAAYLYNTAQSASHDNYSYYTPVSVSVPLGMAQGMSFVRNSAAFSLEDMVNSDCGMYVYSDIMLDPELLDTVKGSTVYERCGRVFDELKRELDAPLASGVTFSCVNAVYGQKAVTEKEQGEMLGEALKAAKDTGLAGAVIYDLNDTWSGVSDEMKKFTASDESTPLWHNTADRARRDRATGRGHKR